MRNEAQLCPVCLGSGEVPPRCDRKVDAERIGMLPCHGCEGKGWVAVPQGDPAAMFPSPLATMAPMLQEDIQRYLRDCARKGAR